MWSHPDISLATLLYFVGGFLDMLALACGYQSSGKPAYWGPQDVTKALQWASLFEEVLGKLSISKEGTESKQTLDVSLLDLMACTHYPPGLPKLSAEVLAEARKFFVDAFVGAHGVDNGQINSLLIAVQRPRDDRQGQTDWLQDYVSQQIVRRYLTFSCNKSLSSALDAASLVHTILPRDMIRGFRIWKDDLLSTSLQRDVTDDQQDAGCQQWRKNSLSYLFNTNTVYKLSGALVIFRANELQWKKVLNTLLEFADNGGEIKVIELAELCCLQLATCKWASLSRMLLCSEISASKMWHWRDQKLYFMDHEASISLRHAVEAYLLELLTGREYLLWKLPPILLASALSRGSRLFRKYMTEIMQQLDTMAISTRNICPCKGFLQMQCSNEVVERLWCIQLQDQVMEEEL